MEQPPPLPPKPTFEDKPRGSWLAIGLAAFGAVAIAIVLSFLTMGFFIPFLLLGLGIFVVIGLQYLIWGWLFERIYRSEGANHESNESHESGRRE